MNAYNAEKNATLVAASQAVEAASALPDLGSGPSMAGGAEVKNALIMFAAAKTGALPDLGSAPSMAGGSEVKNALPLFAATKTDALPNPGSPANVTGESPRLSDAMIASAIARTE